MRLDEAVSEQAKLEDHGHEKEGKLEALNGEIREHVRQIRDLEQAHELERNAMLQEKEQQGSREEEMHATIQRLKEAVAQKDMRIGADGDKNMSRSCKSLSLNFCVILVLIDLQPASATELPQISMANLRHRLKSNGVHHEITRRCFCRKIN